MTENKSFSFFVGGNPVPKQSFRAIIKEKDGKKIVGGYRDSRVSSWQDTIGFIAQATKNHKRNGNEFQGLTGVILEFYLSTARRVDLDNLSKCVLDGLNKILWKDDSCVVDLRIIKFVSAPEPGVKITVWDIENPEYYILKKNKR